MKTLVHRAKTVVSDSEERRKELEHIGKALKCNGYPDWMLPETREASVDSVKEVKEKEVEQDKQDKTQKGKRKYPVTIPYIKGFSEEYRRVLGGYGVPTYFKPTNTLRQLLVRPKDPLKTESVAGPVYRIPCAGGPSEGCESSYVGETERVMGKRFAEHRRPSSSDTSEVARHIHRDHPEHTVDMEKAQILATEPRWFERGVKEAIYIRALKPDLNKDAGRYNLPAVWNNTIEKKVKGPKTRTTERGPKSSDF